MSFPKPCNLQREIRNHVLDGDDYDNDLQQSQQKYTIENTSVGCSGKCV
jgi:hypothetical protein